MLNDIRMIMNSGSVFGYFLQVLPVTCVVGIAFIIFRLIFLHRKKLKIQWTAEIIRLLFICYVTGLFNLIVMPANFWLSLFDGIFLGWWQELRQLFKLGDFNLVPALFRYLSGESGLGSWIKEMLIGNIVMFIPLGFFIPFVTRFFNSKNIFIFSIVISLTAETIQPLFGRSFDIDDIMCNAVGIISGFFIAHGMIKLSEIHKRKTPQAK